MTALESLDALAARIAAGSGPDRRLDAGFARVVCGWAPSGSDFCGWPAGKDDGATYYAPAYPAFTDALAGPGALFAAARALWPDLTIRIEARAGEPVFAWCWRQSGAGTFNGSHPDLSRALMLAMVAAKRAEIAGGAT